jgi:zinc transporter ZupT
MLIEKETAGKAHSAPRFPSWISVAVPLLALGLLVLAFTLTNPLALFTTNLPPVEILSFERIRVVQDGFQVTLINSGPHPVTIAQVQVDDAYWQFTADPAVEIPRFGRVTLAIPYPWVEAEPHVVRVITSTGLTFEDNLAVTTLTPSPGRREFLAYGLLGIYVGVIPVGLGLLWYPTMRRLGRRWLGFLLALTIGLLVFLLIDTFFEVLEVGAELPGVFQGIPLALFAALLTWLAITAIGSRQKARKPGDPAVPDDRAVKAQRSGLYLAGLIALSIGLHNFGEGLAVGAAFALGEAALGSFLVIGFILHNITEGIGIAAPLVPSRKTAEEAAGAAVADSAGENKAGPGLKAFAGLALLAGFPAVLGAWIGGFAFSPLLGTVFLGIGMGAIWQVIVEVTALLRRYAERDGTPFISFLNLAGFLLGLAIMYFTAFLVKF